MRKSVTLVMAALALAGCATPPAGPMVRVMPGPNKPFVVFQQDQAECENYASAQVAGGAEAANNRAVGAAAIGAALGLAVGASTGNGRVATRGAVAGGAIGTVVGANQSEGAQYGLQRRYDDAYAQCMYAKGNQVPGFRGEGGPPPPPPRGNRPPPPR